jgi:hypothetical protein
LHRGRCRLSLVSPLNDGLVPVDRYYAYSVGAELFPTGRLVVRLGYVRWDGEQQLDDGYDVGASWFFRDDVAVVSLTREPNATTSSWSFPRRTRSR